MLKTSVTKAFHFEAAHNLPNYDGDCSHLHGHSYKLEVTVGGPNITESDEMGCGNMVIDFKQLKRKVDYFIIEELDHKYLNEVLPGVPTAEFMCAWIYERLSNPRIGDLKGIKRIRLWETADSFAEVEVIGE